MNLSSLPTSSAAAHPLAPYGWDPGWEAEFASYCEQGLLPGRVVRVDRGQCDVVTPVGTVRADTEFTLSWNPMTAVCTGDWVAVDREDGDTRYVRTLLPRRTAFVRSSSSKHSKGQLLATNIDHVIICVSLGNELDLARIERFLALALSCSTGEALLRGTSGSVKSTAQPLVVLTKADVVPDAVTLSYLVQDVEATAPGVPVLPVSARSGDGLDVLAAVASGGTSVLLGQSGAGKSTLANALLGEDTMEVQAIRDVDGKGRHTTTTRNLLVLPGGGVLIDTPGLRGVGLFDAESGVGQVFSDIAEVAERCRFHDCAHDREPGCAVLAAIESGELAERRLESYHKLMRENQWIVAKTDVRVRSELRRDNKRKRAEGRAAMEAKRGRGL
ncbi:ribosome small subunit-dependent GTPase A [Streptomyces lydicamycinicus]|uniref:Small ribosomal subunit biogenesis GTPase RsgA n=1 Tax=Streptomyces lydicamycinicus TaxID=1546107 RepID=A0A0P4RCH0_9ACTN|nr:ribosome small subunit-dependent GTPase A [Streptomyces lydicamycinicus]USA00700.1 ribosome small subunit-dependent GTPase A [Streptomyces lydicamycinicus]GAO11292.1 putative ribosome biogenesis GTPase RsgA [Streptomyces lydicamycinicus]